MSNNSKIQITCDLCDRKCSPENVMEVKYEREYRSFLWLSCPSLSSEHFICHECLKKLGWHEETEKPADTPNAADSSNNTSTAI